MEDWGLENIRLNICFVMIDGGDAISLDELNEILNLWNKSCVGTPYFAKACERSKLIMLLRKCAYETYGKRESHSVSCSDTLDISRIIDLFVRANIFESHVK